MQDCFQDDAELTAAINGLEVRDKDGKLDVSRSGYISKAQLEKIEILDFYVKIRSEKNVKWAEYTANYDLDDIDYSELVKFTNLRQVSIDQIKIRNIEFPTTLKSLIIKRCTIGTDKNPDLKLDVSGCKDLEDFIFTDSSFYGRDGDEIIGLNADRGANPVVVSELAKLKNINISGSDVTKMGLYYADGIYCDGLLVETSNCMELSSFNSGSYRVAGSPDLKNSTKLKQLDISVICSKDKQILNLAGCCGLEKVNINYYYSDKDLIYEIDVTGNTRNSGELTCEKIEGSATGVMKLSADENCFVYKSASNDYTALFTSLVPVSASVAFIVPKQDLENFIKNQLWDDDNASKRRSYSANPIYLFVGDKIEDNRMFMFTAGGVLLADNNYNIKIINEVIPTEISDGTDYNVLSVDRSTGGTDTVTALNPGMARLRIDVNDGSGKSAEQLIVVPNIVTDIKYKEVSAPMFFGAAKETYYLELTPKYPSLCNYSGLILGGYSVGGVLSHEIASTPAGLSIKDNNYIYDSAKKKIMYNFDIEIQDDVDSGTYKLRTYFSLNYKDGTHVLGDKTEKERIVSDDFEFSILNLKSGSKNLTYGMDRYSDDTGVVNVSNYPDTVYLEVPAETTRYKAGVPVIRDYQLYKDFIKMEPAGDNRYKLSFHDGGTGSVSDNVAKGLGRLQNGTENIELKADVAVTNKSTNTQTTMTKTWNLIGYFTADYYDEDGVTKINTTNPSSYFIPAKGMHGDLFDYTLTDTPSRNGYDFKNWYCDNKPATKLGGDVFGDVSLVARWEANTYTVSWNAVGGSVSLSENKVTYDSAYGELPTPTREGYDFTGWYTEKEAGEKVESTTIVKVAGNHTLYAHWSKIADQTDTGNTDAGNTDAGNTDAGNTDAGNTGNTDAGNTEVPTAGDTDIYATINIGASNAVVTVSVDGGTVDGELYTVKGKNLLLAKPVKDGSTFKCWTYVDAKTGKTKKVSKLTEQILKNNPELVLKAVYIENTYSINYKVKAPKGFKLASKVKSLKKIKYDDEVSLAESITATNKKTGETMVLVGWTKTQNGETIDFVPGQKVSRLAGKTKKDKKVVLYPVWKNVE